LTEDLLEVSKASSGTLPVSLMETDAGELLVQAIGEYTERFAARDLMPILNVPELPLLISADGKCLWRVFDNLLSNICKYSMPGTRIYFSAQTDGKTALIVFRNISEQAISLDADELKERFVRGDTSRHSEGSGLGLAIADSLVSLQNGRMQVTVDGDLFKVSLTFPLFQ